MMRSTITRGLNLGEKTTRASLDPSQRKIIDIIEGLGFGMIRRLSCQNGLPCFDPAPQITQDVRLGRNAGGAADGNPGDILKKEFVELFIQMNKLREGHVDIEVRHSMPFTLVLERSHSEFG